MTQALIWFVIAILAGIFEIVTVDLVSIWIAIGALVAAILAALKIPLVYQLIAVLVVSVGLGIITRPYAKKILRGNITATNSDRLIGKNAIITKGFNKDERGELKVAGEHWTCFSKENHNFTEGEQVKILAIEGVKLLVTTIK